MSYESLGQIAQSQFVFTPTTSTSPSTTTAPAAGTPDAWRIPVRDQAIVTANVAGAMSTAEKQHGGEALANFIRYMLVIAGGARTRSKEEMIILIASPAASVPRIFESPVLWTTAGVRSLREAIAKLRTIIPSMEVAVRSPTLSVKLPTTQISVAPRPAPVTTTPVTTSTPSGEVACPDGYFRDAAGLCVPGAPIPADLSAQQPAVTTFTPGPETSLLPPPSSGPLGVSLKWWGLGAAGIAATALLLRSNKNVSPNTRRRRRRRS